MDRKKLHERIQVVYEDQDVLVIEKASGIITYPVEGQAFGSAIQLIRRYWKAQGRKNQHLYLLHRLDKETSGLLLFAKTSLARRSLRAQFEKHSVLRSYLAVTHGLPQKQKGKIWTLLGRNASGKRAVAARGKQAHTSFEVVASDPRKERALVRCRLRTGRTHQVRIHLAHLRTPVLGDAVYGRDNTHRLALHAEALGFYHPRTGRALHFRSSLPAELKLLL